MTNDNLIPVLAGLTASVLLVDANRRIVFANPAAVERFGGDYVGRDLVRAVRHPDCLLQALDDVLAGGRAGQGDDRELQTPTRVTLQVTVAGLNTAGDVRRACGDLF